MIATSGKWVAIIDEHGVVLKGPADGYSKGRNLTEKTGEFIGAFSKDCDTLVHEDLLFEHIFSLAEKEIGKLPEALYVEDGPDSHIMFDVDKGGPIRFTKAQLDLLSKTRCIGNGSLIISKEPLKSVARNLKALGLVTINRTSFFEIVLTPAGTFVADEQGGIKYRNRYKFTKEALARVS